MIGVNLLPHRARQRRQRQQRFYQRMALAVLAGLAAQAIADRMLDARLVQQQLRNHALQAQTQTLQAAVRATDALRTEIAGLHQQQQRFEDLQWRQRCTARLLEELARHTPAGVFLRRLQQNGSRFILRGEASSAQDVLQLRHNLANHATTLTQTELQEMRRADTTAQDQDGHALHHHFVLSASYRPSPPPAARYR